MPHAVWIVRTAARVATGVFALFMIIYLLTSPDAEVMRDQWARGNRVDLLSGWFTAWLLLAGPFAVAALVWRMLDCGLRRDFDPIGTKERTR